MKVRMVSAAILALVSLIARADVLGDYEDALLSGDFAKAREHLSRLNDASQVSGYQELVRAFEACEEFISLADQHMIMPSAVPIEKLDAQYEAIAFRGSNAAISDAIFDRLNERLQRAKQMLDFAHNQLSPETVNKFANENAAQTAREQELRAACGVDYHQIKVGMTMDRARMCVGTPYLVDVRNRRGAYESTYQIGQYHVRVMGELIVGYAK